MAKRILGCVIVSLCFVLGAGAEFRVWSSQDGGSTIEAQFVKVEGVRVVLEKKDGSRLIVPRAKLCKADQEYLAEVIPPVLAVEISKGKERNDQYKGAYTTSKENTITVTATIKKVNKDPCSWEFKAYLYVVAKAYKGDGRKVIGSKDMSFSFGKKSSASMSAEGSVYVSDSKYGGKSGWKYEGYIVVVEDKDGKVLMIDTNKGSYENVLNKIKKGGSFDI